MDVVWIFTYMGIFSFIWDSAGVSFDLNSICCSYTGATTMWRYQKIISVCSSSTVILEPLTLSDKDHGFSVKRKYIACLLSRNAWLAPHLPFDVWGALCQFKFQIITWISFNWFVPLADLDLEQASLRNWQGRIKKMASCSYGVIPIWFSVLIIALVDWRDDVGTNRFSVETILLLQRQSYWNLMLIFLNEKLWALEVVCIILHQLTIHLNVY